MKARSPEYLTRTTMQLGLKKTPDSTKVTCSEMVHLRAEADFGGGRTSSNIFQ